MSVDSHLSIPMTRLSQYLRWGFWLTLTTFALAVVVSLLAPDPAFQPSRGASALSIGGTVALLSILIASRWLVQRGRLSTALRLLIPGGLLAGVLYVLADPALLIQTSFYPLMVLLLALPHLGRPTLRRVAGAAIGCSVLLTLLAQWVQFFPGATMAPLARQWYTLVALPGSVGIVVLLIWQVHQYLSDALAEAQQAQRATERARAALEVEVAARTAELHATVATLQQESVRQQALVAELAQQRDVVRQLSVPILPLDARTLVMPLIGALDENRLAALTTTLLQHAQQRHARRVLLDVTGVPLLDAAQAQGLVRIIRAARLLGTQVVLIGIRPDVAEGLVATGLDTAAVATAPDLATALAAESRGRDRG